MSFESFYPTVEQETAAVGHFESLEGAVEGRRLAEATLLGRFDRGDNRVAGAMAVMSQMAERIVVGE